MKSFWPSSAYSQRPVAELGQIADSSDTMLPVMTFVVWMGELTNGSGEVSTKLIESGALLTGVLDPLRLATSCSVAFAPTSPVFTNVNAELVWPAGIVTVNVPSLFSVLIPDPTSTPKADGGAPPVSVSVTVCAAVLGASTETV